MKIVADTNTFISVALDEPEKEWLIAVTDGHNLVAPAVLPYEIGNALSSLVRRKLVMETQLAAIWDAAMSVPVELAVVDTRASLLLAGRFGIYAYDAYFLQCSLETRSPLLTLDRGLKYAAGKLDITLVEDV